MITVNHLWPWSCHRTIQTSLKTKPFSGIITLIFYQFSSRARRWKLHLRVDRVITSAWRTGQVISLVLRLHGRQKVFLLSRPDSHRKNPDSGINPIKRVSLQLVVTNYCLIWMYNLRHFMSLLHNRFNIVRICLKLRSFILIRWIKILP